jgi:GDP-L-fucose synthase
MRPDDQPHLPRGARVLVAGGDTLLGAALCQRLRSEGVCLVGAPDGPALTDAAQVEAFFAETRPEYVFLAAGKSGGIRANQAYPATLMRDNLLVIANVLHAAYLGRVRRLLYLASSCCYPRLAAQPLAVESLMTGPLEPTNEAYATAKLAGIALCRAYRQEHGADFVPVLPANSFGPHDHFDAADAHVIPSLMRRMHEEKARGDESLSIWGTGRARREFVYAPDLADAAVFVMARYRGAGPLNLAGGPDLSVAELAEAVAEVVGFRGRLVFDAGKPDGMPLKGLDAGPLRELGWIPTTDFRTALVETYAWFLHNVVREETGDVRAAV